MWLNFILLSVFGFSGSLTTTFDLRGVIDGNRMAGVPLGISLGSGELDVEGICTKAGMACQNCSLAVTCVPLPVGWLKLPLEECAEGFTCNAHLGQCSMSPVPECSAAAQEFKHTCEQVGIFPDAYDCRKFHLCSPPEGLPDGRPADHREALCPRHYGYNPQTAQCSIKLENSQCSAIPVPECKFVAQHGVLQMSTNHYYVCLIKNGILHPQIFICPHGWHFWGEFCQPEPEPTGNPNAFKKDSSEEKSSEEKSSEEHSKEKNTQKEITSVNTEEDSTTIRVTTPTENFVSTEKATTTKIEGFFSTEKATTYAADTFLADRFDVANYETTDDVAPTNDEFVNSFENSNEFW